MKYKYSLVRTILYSVQSELDSYNYSRVKKVFVVRVFFVIFFNIVIHITTLKIFKNYFMT